MARITLGASGFFLLIINCLEDSFPSIEIIASMCYSIFFMCLLGTMHFSQNILNKDQHVELNLNPG